MPRPRLLQKLADKAETTLILVAASAGSGKTTLIVQWLADIADPVAWLSLDENDNDLTVFLRYVVAAVQGVFARSCSATQKLLHSPKLPATGHLAAVLANELSDIGQPFVLVLDDFHHLRDPAIHEVVDRLLRHTPPGLRVVISSRFDPPLALSRLASQGKLVEIRAADLRFRTGEAQALLDRIAGASLPGDRLDALVAETDGWAIGILSAAIALRQGDLEVKPAADGLAGPHRRLVDILDDEVFAVQPAFVRDFLMRTSVVSRMTAPLCQALLASDSSGEALSVDSQAMLQRLERDSLFVEALDDGHRWYRYHNLFHQFLARKLAQSYDAATIASLHRRASLWHREHGSAAEAIHHALAAQDSALAADIVEAQLYEILNREEWPVLERWLPMVPGETVQRRPLLLVAQATVLYFQFKLQAIPPLLAQAESLLAADPELASAAVLGNIDMLHTLLSFVSGDYPGTIESAQKALSRLGPGNAFVRGHTVFLLGLSLYALYGERSAAEFYTRIIDDPLEDVTVRSRALVSWCHMLGIACRPVAQEQVARVLLKLAQEHNLDVSIAWAHRHLGNSYYERDDLASAVHHFAQVVEHRYLAHFVCARDSFIGLALAYQAMGCSEDAETVAAALQEFCVERGLANLSDLDSTQARLALLRGDTGRALAKVDRSRGSTGAQSMIAYETATLTRAMVHLVAGSENQRHGAVALLAGLKRRA